jgi:hypothetical protein
VADEAEGENDIKVQVEVVRRAEEVKMTKKSSSSKKATQAK